MWKISKFILGTIVFLSSVYSLYTDNFKFQPYITLLMGLMMLVMGIDELKKGKKGYGYLSIGVSGFVFLVFLQGFIM
jgi:Protein of unknown function (DUF3953)